MQISMYWINLAETKTDTKSSTSPLLSRNLHRLSDVQINNYFHLMMTWLIHGIFRVLEDI